MIQLLSLGKEKIKSHALAVRFSKFLFVFDLRQGAILIAVQNIAVSGCTLIMLLVGIAHALETMNILNADMEDNAEREGAILINDDDLSLFHDAPLEITNNQKKFKVAYHLAIMMVFFLYSSLVGTTIYLIFCVGLFYGAAKKKKEYIMPWILYATFSVIMLIAALFVGDKSDTLTRICGGHVMYRFGSSLIVIGHVYCIVAVVSYVYELNQLSAKKKTSTSTLQSTVDISDKHVLITKDSIKLPFNNCHMTTEANHV